VGVSREQAAVALRAVNVLGSGLASGGQMTVLLAIVPVARKWPAERSIDLHRETLTNRPDRFLRPISAASVACGMLSQAVERKHSRTSIGFQLGGLGAMLTVLLLSERFEFPTNRMLLDLPSPADVPPDYDKIRSKWDRIHALRAASGLTAAVCYALSALTRTA
jgi:hypothetical protein